MVGDSGLMQSLRMIDAVYRMCAAHPKQVALALTRGDVLRAMRSDRLAVIMTIEGQSMFANEVAHVRTWRRLGVRVASITHGEGRIGGRQPFALQQDNSHYGYLAPAQREKVRRRTRGLTPFARESLDEMAELGMACDVSHINDAAFWQVMEHARGPVCDTHACCYALCPHTRNLTDEMMKALAQRGGVLGICLYPPFVAEKDPSLNRLVEHFLHALEVMGSDHVGLGTDHDGMQYYMDPLLGDAAGLPALWEALAAKGVIVDVLEKIAYKNFLRMLPE
jgi:membrane dipeptidase